MARTKRASAARTPAATRPQRTSRKKVEELKAMKEAPPPESAPAPASNSPEYTPDEGVTMTGGIAMEVTQTPPVPPPVTTTDNTDLSPRMKKILAKQAEKEAAPKPPPPPKPDVTNKPKAPDKMKFQLISGKHDISIKLDPATGKMERRRLTTGDIIETTDDLCAIFPNRFRRVMPEEVQQKPSPRASTRASVLTETVTKEAAKRGKAPTRVRVMNRQGDRYDVIREDNGLPLNDKFLTLAEAKDLETKMNAAADAAEKNPPPAPAPRPKLRPPNPNPMLIE